MSNPLVQHFSMLARYNTLVNRLLYETCAPIGDAELKKWRPAFFGSIHGTLYHVMVGDRIWLARFGGEEVPSTGLEEIPYADFDELRCAREAEDERIEAFASEINEEFLDATIRYVDNQGRLFEDPVYLLVAHFFNHQTHHRGQVHDLLTQTGGGTPVLDLHLASSVTARRFIVPTPCQAQGGALEVN